MAYYHRIGWTYAKWMARNLSAYHVHRMALLFAEHGRPMVERQPRECPICGHEGPFAPFFGANAIRFDAHCPKCNSRERHRFLKLWMDEDPRGAAFGDVLHFAPEPELRDDLAARSRTYRTADIAAGAADLRLNLEAIDLPDQSVDVVVANHVLEHVVAADAALAEIRRILRPGGFAILTTPVVYIWDNSYENPAIGDGDRFSHFGQADHVRHFGRDIETRIQQAGLTLDRIVADGANAARYGLIPGDAIYLGIRPAT